MVWVNAPTDKKVKAAEEATDQARRVIQNATVYLKAACNPRETNTMVRFATREAMKHLMNAFWAWGWTKAYFNAQKYMNGEMPTNEEASGGLESTRQ